MPDGSGTNSSLWTTPPTITFSPTTGEIKSITGVTANADGSYTLPVTTMPAGFTFPTGDTWSVDFPAPGSANAVTQFGGEQTAQLATQNGNAAGTLESFTDRWGRDHQRSVLQRSDGADRAAGPGNVLQPDRSDRRRQSHVLGVGELGSARHGHIGDGWARDLLRRLLSRVPTSISPRS